MNCRVLSAMAFVLMLTTSHLVLAKTDDPKTAPRAPDGWILVEEDIWLLFPDEPGAQFHQAHETFLKKDFKAAAAHIRKGVGFMKLEAARAAGDGKKALTTSIDALEKLASDVEKGAVKSTNDLSKAFSRAHHALAVHHHLKASEAWAKKETSKTGHALKAAASHLEKALAWSGHKIEAAVVKVMEIGHDVGEKLIQGARWTADEVGKALKDSGEAIERLAED